MRTFLSRSCLLASGLAAALGFSSCKTPADANAPRAQTPVLASVERHTPPSSWSRVSPATNKYTVATATLGAAPAAGQPTLAVNFSGPAAGSDFEIKVDTKIAASGGGFDAGTKQQAAEAADLPWYYREFPNTNLGRLVVRLPNSLLINGGEAVLSIVNLSRNTVATGTDKISAPLTLTIVVARPGSPTNPPTNPPAAPAITSLSPAVLVPGQPVTITGVNFDPNCANNRVRLDACRVITPTSCSATAITFTAPDPLPHEVDLQLVTGNRTLTRNNVVVRRRAGVFTEVTPDRSAGAITRTLSRYVISTVNGVSGVPETTIREMPAGPNARTSPPIPWTVGAPNPGRPGSDLAGIAVSPGEASVLILSEDTLVPNGGKRASFVYTANCAWNPTTFSFSQFGFRADGSLFVFIAPRFFFSPDGSVVAILHLASPPVQPAGNIPSNLQITVFDLSSGQPKGSDYLQPGGAGLRIEMGVEAGRDTVSITGERSTFVGQSDISTRKISL